MVGEKTTTLWSILNADTINSIAYGATNKPIVNTMNYQKSRYHYNTKHDRQHNNNRRERKLFTPKYTTLGEEYVSTLDIVYVSTLDILSQ